MATKCKRPACSKMTSKSKSAKKEIKKEAKKDTKKSVKAPTKKVSGTKISAKIAKASASKSAAPAKKTVAKLSKEKEIKAKATEVKKSGAKTVQGTNLGKKSKVVNREEAIKKYKAAKGSVDISDEEAKSQEEEFAEDGDDDNDKYEKDFADKELDDFEHLGDEAEEEVLDDVEEDEEGNFGAKRQEANRQLEEYNPDEDHEETPDNQRSYGWGYSDTFDKPEDEAVSNEDDLDEDELYARGANEDDV